MGMEAIKMRKVLRLMKRGEAVTERWLTSKGECTLAELTDLIEKRFLVRFDKKPHDFMDDNRYMITDQGFEYAWM